MRAGTRGWIADGVVGAIVGAVVGAIVAVNFVIYAGVEGGYEASLPEVYRKNVLLGIVVTAVLGCGPVLGVVAARRWRRRRKS